MADWLTIVNEAAEQRLRDHKPLFLAQIPTLLKRYGINVEEVLRGRPMREALSLDALGRLRLVRDPNRPLVWAVIPVNAPVEIDLESLFSPSPPTTEPQRLADANQGAAPRFKKWFWAAFIRALDPENKRWLLGERFQDVAGTTPVPAAVHVIEPMDILNIDPGVPADPNLVYAAMQRWATRTGVDLDEYRLDLTLTQRLSRGALTFESIDPEDAKRVMIPLDVVMKLLRR